MKRSVFWIVVLFIVLACGKTRTTEYAGIVVDLNNNPISDVTISYVYTAGASGISDGEEKTSTLAVSKSDGTFEGKIKLRKKEVVKNFSARGVGLRTPPKDSTKIWRIVLR